MDTGYTVIVELSAIGASGTALGSIERREGDRGSMTLEFFEEEREILDLILCCSGGERVPYLSRRDELLEPEQGWRGVIIGGP